MSSQWFVNLRCWVCKSKGGSSGPHCVADSTWNGKHWVLTPLRATKILWRKLSWPFCQGREKRNQSQFLQWCAGSTELKIIKANLVDKISRYKSKPCGKRYCAKAWRFTRDWAAPVRWPKARQPLEERRAYCPAVSVPAASSLMGLLPTTVCLTRCFK